MESVIIIAVLAAAVFHASWNFLVKNTEEKSVAILAVTLGQVPFSILGLAFTGLPPTETLGYVFASGFLHTGYMIFLLHAYRLGDLSVVYPIARGLSPIILTAITLIFLQEALSMPEVYGILLIAAAIISIGMAQIKTSQTGLMPILLAMVTGCFIAAYSMVDALGTRLGGNAFSFFGSVAILSAIFVSAYIVVSQRETFKVVLISHKLLMSVGGGISYFAYIIVLWACLYAPISVVSSLRETSVFFAVIFGVLLLGEKLTISKILSSILIVLGIALTRIG